MKESNLKVPAKGRKCLVGMSTRASIPITPKRMMYPQIIKISSTLRVKETNKGTEVVNEGLLL